ncbi:hypothetical protein PV05_08589 [Exophiala xenobiotica]|uniref:Uncharacterized protein n=1 Tax=Exophiala xenobiotica TaxID=348802 RepID=A0A0D2CSJ4_9EURO|nr:uncharacterized protein PV05_08589 [Exophiala xenobiotica]KIW52982.1 hypothetical protein PV05_08589 [Exophiala xenobiotica]
MLKKGVEQSRSSEHFLKQSPSKDDIFKLVQDRQDMNASKGSALCPVAEVYEMTYSFLSPIAVRSSQLRSSSHMWIIFSELRCNTVLKRRVTRR